MIRIFDFKTFFNFLGKHKLYTAINIIGLAVALMFVILFTAYTVQEFTVDDFQTKGDRIYLMASTGSETEMEDMLGSSSIIGRHFQDRYPEIEAYCNIWRSSQMQSLNVNNAIFPYHIMFVDTTFFSMFDFTLKQGDKSTALGNKNNAIISESFAGKIFTNVNPIGQSLHLTNDMTVTVSGIIKDIKHSIIPDADIILRFDNTETFDNSIFTGGSTGEVQTFFLAREGADLKHLEKDMADFCKTFYWMYQSDWVKYTGVDLVKMRDVYLDNTYDVVEGTLLQNNRSQVLILLSVALLILFFGITNYINLTVAQSSFRFKEMAARRLLGSSRREIIVRLISESVLMLLISCLIAIFLAFAFQDMVNRLMEYNIDVAILVKPIYILFSVLAILLLGIIAGLIPAVIISRAKPIDVMKGGMDKRNKMVFSKVFITLQNVITITFIACAITMNRQAHHLVNAPLGFNSDSIINILFPYNAVSRDMQRTLVDELNRLGCVDKTSLHAGSPSLTGNNNVKIYNGKQVTVEIFRADKNFIDILGLKFLERNDVALGNDYPYYATPSAYKMLGIPHDAKVVDFDGDYDFQLGGVIADFTVGNMERNKRPVFVQIIDFDAYQNPYIWGVLVKINGDPAAAFKQVKEVYERVTGLYFEGEFMNDEIAAEFAPVTRISKIAIVFGVVSVVISLLGLLAMSTYFVQQRKREIAVRKIFGSTSLEVLGKLMGAFLTYVAIAFIIAVPIIYYVMDEWLSEYAYRISLSPLIFIAAGLFCLLAAAATVLWQSMRAAAANPADTIKSE
jgi:putative ABC transport system permease protein